MDAFKILSRSTTLNRKGGKQSALAPTPSSGQATNPQLFGHSPVLDFESPSPPNDHSVTNGSRKRKRGQMAMPMVEATPKELNFFDEPSKVGKKDKEQIESEHGVESTQDAKPSVDIGAAENNADLPEEECRRILKSHKLKITQLWAPVNAPPPPLSEQRQKKRKKNAAATIPKENEKPKKRRLEITPQPLTSFAQLSSHYDISKKLAENIEAQGYTLPTEVQLGSLPLLLSSTTGQSKTEDTWSAPDCGIDLDIDLLTVAPTGSGKTLAFLIPVVNALVKQRIRDAAILKEEPDFFLNAEAGPKAIIIAPTKELASQITNEGMKLTKRTGVKVTLVRKGMDIVEHLNTTSSSGKGEVPEAALHDEEESIDEDSDSDSNGDNTRKVSGSAQPVVKSDILVSTPLTLLHAMTYNSRVMPLPSVKYIIFDEADVLLDPLFREQTMQIWARCTNPNARISLWSATMGSSIEDLARSTLEERYQRLSTSTVSETVIKPRLVRLVVGLKDSAIPNIHHKLVYAASEQGKLMALRQLVRPTCVSTDGPVLRPPFLVFTQTIPRAVALHSELLYDIPQEAGGFTRIAVLHADLTDSAREHVMTRFRKGEIWILITTDLLSRGVDFRGVNGVVNYDFPNSSAVYVHRVGRTGRAGREGGVAVTLYAEEDVPFLKNVANVIAASERQKGMKGKGEGVQQWLLDALPKPSKRDKQQLKKRGIESRRTGITKGEKLVVKSRTRISTKSGFERRLENNRRNAVMEGKTRKKVVVRGENGGGGGDEDGFSGFED